MKRLLITGAAGFIGMNLARHMKGKLELILLDDFSREGSAKNASILQEMGLRVHRIDVSDELSLNSFLDSQGSFDGLFHLAAQTSLLESIKEPKIDFNTNALGSVNLLEYLRVHLPNCKGVFLASNKVYGNLKQLEYSELVTRYQIIGFPAGLDESLPVVPEGGYSISKSISDYYVNEYGSRFSMPVISLRQSAVYGPNQNPRSDQGWVSFFTGQYISNSKVQLRGIGKQVRDILHVDDFCMLAENLLQQDLPHGEAFNVGGGGEFAISILELFNILETIGGKPMQFETGVMSEEDQKYYVSNNQKITKLTGWAPAISPEAGVLKLYKSIAASH